MKYKSKLIIPTLVTTAFFSASLTALADEQVNNQESIAIQEDNTVLSNPHETPVENDQRKVENKEPELDINSDPNALHKKKLNVTNNEVDESLQDKDVENDKVNSSTNPLVINNERDEESPEPKQDKANNSNNSPNINKDADEESSRPIQQESLVEEQESIATENDSQTSDLEEDPIYEPSEETLVTHDKQTTDVDSEIKTETSLESSEENQNDTSGNDTYLDQATNMKKEVKSTESSETTKFQDGSQSSEGVSSIQKTSSEMNIETDTTESSVKSQEDVKPRTDENQKSTESSVSIQNDHPLIEEESSDKEMVKDNKVELMSMSLNTNQAPEYFTDYKLGRISNSDAEIKLDLSSSETRNPSRFLTDTYLIQQKALYNGDVYYKLQSEVNRGLIGWIKEKDLDLKEREVRKFENGDFKLLNNNGGIHSQAWGTDSQIVKRYDQLTTPLFTAKYVMDTEDSVYYFGSFDKDEGWILASDLSEKVHYKTDYKMARVSSNTTRIYTDVRDENSYRNDNLSGKTYYVQRSAEFNGETYHMVQNGITGGRHGWVKSDDLSTAERSVRKVDQGNYYTTKTGDFEILPWATASQKSSLKPYTSVPFKVEYSMEVNNEKYLYGTFDKSGGWIKSSVLAKAPKIKTSYHLARINNTATVFNNITDWNGQTHNAPTDRTLLVQRHAKFNGEDYYQLADDYSNAHIGWFKANDLNIVDRSVRRFESGEYTIKGDAIGNLTTIPWGTSSQYIADLSNINNQIFDVKYGMTVDSENYFYGKTTNYEGWINEAQLVDIIVETVEYNKPFEEVLDIQMNLLAKPQAWVSGGGWRNATRDEVAYYLDTSHQNSDDWMYTFLNLNKAQNIAGSVLNNILVGKGSLENSGYAFNTASRYHGVNEVYLISHALHETGNGTSTLSQGVRLNSNGNISNDGKVYYNVFGIGAYDHNPVLEGARFAKSQGWDTIEKAIIGGAQWISSGYFNRGQNTLYSMRWNPDNTGTYQYATDINWAYATARNIKNYYDILGVRGNYYTKHIF